MTRRSSPRLAGYAGLAALALVAGLAAGRVELVALAAPFALAAVIGAAVGREPQLDATLALDRERALEDDDVQLALELSSSTGASRVDVLVLLPGSLPTARPNPRAVRLAPEETRTIAA